MSFICSSIQYSMSIYQAINAAIEYAFHNTNLPEPRLVANFLRRLTHNINDEQTRFRSHSGVKVHAGGIFIHASPFVSYKKSHNTPPVTIELGDLLLIKTVVDQREIKNQSALLLQVKKTVQIPESSTNQNQNQYYLYSTWPTFTYTNPSPIPTTPAPLIGKKRTIRCNDISNGTKYLLINTSGTPWHDFWYSEYFWPHRWLGHCSLAATAIATHEGMSHHECFAHELMRFILADGGKSFALPPKRRSNRWDRVIQDLLSYVAATKTKFMSESSTVRTSRGFELYASDSDTFHSHSSLCSSGILGDDNSEVPPDDTEREVGDDDVRGLSILEFVVSHQEGQRE